MAKYTEQQIEQMRKIRKEEDRVKRWKMIHDLLADVNKVAKREQKKQSKAMKKVRISGIYNNEKDKIARSKSGLKFTVSIPNVTYQALVQLDKEIFGKSDLQNPDKIKHLTKDATNSIARDLARALPQYKAS